MKPEDDFFLDGNYGRYNSYVMLTNSEASHLQPIKELESCTSFFQCSQLGCNQYFSSLQKYEEHVFNNHQNQCSVCKKSFPTERLLSMHLSELHDSYFAAMSQKVASYLCVVASCNAVFWSNEDRREHLLTVHLFPASYDFHDPNKYMRKYKQHRRKGIGSATSSEQIPSKSKLRRAKQKNSGQRRILNNSNMTGNIEMIIEESDAVTAKNNSLSIFRINESCSGVNNDTGIDVLCQSFQKSSLKVPDNITFGRRERKTFKS